MPISEYYKGKGRKVMEQMRRRYGKKKGERIFYATANKYGLRPKGSGRFTDEEIAKGYRRVG